MGKNIKLKNYNADLEKMLNQKKEILRRDFQESKQKHVYNAEMDYGNGPKAISSRYDEAQIKTYIPGATAKPMLEAYDEGVLNRTKPSFYYTDRWTTQIPNHPNNDRLNYTDINININNNNQMKNSFKTNDFNSNNLSYKTYNKTLDTNNIYANDSDRDSQDNYSKKRKPKKLQKVKKLMIMRMNIIIILFKIEMYLLIMNTIKIVKEI